MEFDSSDGYFYIHIIWLKDGGELYYMRITPDNTSRSAVSWMMLKDVNTIYEAVWIGSSKDTTLGSTDPLAFSAFESYAVGRVYKLKYHTGDEIDFDKGSYTVIPTLLIPD